MKVMCEAKKKATQVTLMVRPVDKPNGDWVTFLVKIQHKKSRMSMMRMITPQQENPPWSQQGRARQLSYAI